MAGLPSQPGTRKSPVKSGAFLILKSECDFEIEITGRKIIA